MSALKARLFRQCPKTGRIVGVRRPEGWLRVFWPLIGLAALIWFVVRVAPKPSRAAYPCQRVAMPLASSFVLWLAGMAGAGLAIGGARRNFRQARWMSGGLAVALAVVGLGWGVASLQTRAMAYTPHAPNAPIGVAKGLAPGRVVWVHDTRVTDWAGPGSGQRWYQRVDQTVTSNMLATALQSYANAGSSAAAWDAIFRYHNGGAPYQAGQKIFIKVNLTTSYAGGGTANIVSSTNYNWNPQSPLNFDSTATTPQLMQALLDQLVNQAGVAQSDITIGDPTGLWINEWYTPLHNAFPNVKYLDNYGQQGRVRAEFSTTPLYWSTSEANGKQQDYLPVGIADATYMINLAVLKSHEGGGVTNTAKNHYGSLLRTPLNSLRGVTGNWYQLHERLPGPGYRRNDTMTLPGQYRPLVDLNGHAGFGGKTVLYMIDGAFGGKNWNSAPSTWPLAPFNGDWPSSLFISMDQVAIDSVAFDFVSQQWPDQAIMNEGVEDYLHEMALANNPPSGTFYDPERDGVPMASLGVHEHWNNPTAKQYTRNLGTGNGIELVYINPQQTPTATPTPTNTWTPVPPTATPTNTWTPVPPTATPTNTFTPVPPPTATPTNTFTPVPPPTATPTNTFTPVPPPTATPTFTATPVPPTATPTAVPGAATILRTGSAPVLDGAVDALWAGANSYPVANVTLGTAVPASDLSASFRALYDAANLYLLVQVSDQTLVNDSGTGWYHDDTVEVFIDGDYSRSATAYDGVNDFQLAVRYNDGNVVIRGSNSAPVPAGAQASLATATDGYVLEMTLPLAQIGVTPVDGALLGLDVQVNDDDDGGDRDSKMAWWSTDDNTWQYPSLFGTGVLNQTLIPTPVPPTATPTFTATPVPPTATPTRTATPVPPTATPTRTATPVPPTATPTPAACTGKSILFVGSTNPLEARDQALVNRLTSAGHTVTVRSQTQSATSDATGKNLVIISDSVTSTSVNTKFRDVAVPVVNWEPSLLDDMQMTGTTWMTDYGDLSSQTQIVITNSTHPLAAGLSGTVATTNSGQIYFWGAPGSSAVKVAALVGYPSRTSIFAYDTGAAMVGMTAPARRVGFFNGYATAFTADSWALFDAAIAWSLSCPVP